MRTTKTVTYALACLKELARHFGEFVQVAEIARSQNIPQAYCQKILLSLSRSGIVESVKGRGFILNKTVETITILDVVKSLNSESEAADGDANGSVRIIHDLLTARLHRIFSQLSVAEAVSGLQ